MRKTNNKGITLIALIVTIIVLIIIAGASIATLTSDNGILRQVNSAKVTQIESNAREQVKLACSAMRLAVAEAQAKDNSYSAKANSSLIQAKLIEVLNADKKDLTGSFSNGGTAAGDDQAEVTIVYVGEDYTNASNDPDAKITYTIGIEQKTVELKDESNVTLKDQNGNDVVIDIGGSTGNVSNANYLVDTVEIGDYVDIGIEYTNQGSYYYNSTYNVNNYTSTNGPIGWRVLSKNGNSETGTVTLVSAGFPLTFYHPYTNPGSSATSLEYLADLNKEITLVSGSTQGFVKNGLSSNNLAAVWASNSRINTSKGVHALTIDELKTMYTEITGVTPSSNEFATNTKYMISVAANAGKTMSTKAYDLLDNDIAYWLGGTYYDTQRLWYVETARERSTGGTAGGEFCVRPVLNLNARVEISSDNTGDGSSSTSAYKLK